MAKHPAIFLDRDGTMIDDVGYIKQASEVKFYPFTIEALNLLQEYFLLFIITNQSGIATGIITEKQVKDDLSQSFIIGDHPSDVECGINAGITPVYVLTGHGDKHKNETSIND
jgi:histidinol phosphatase-like enzyme